VTQAVDIWPAAAGYRDITYNGEKMQSAAERYRTNKVIAPVGIGTTTIVSPTAAPSAPAITP